MVNIVALPQIILIAFLAASAGIWQSDYRRVGGQEEGNGDERTNLSSS